MGKKRIKLNECNFPYFLVIDRVLKNITNDSRRPKQLSDIDKDTSMFLRKKYTIGLDRSYEIAMYIRESCIFNYFEVIPISPFGDKRINIKKRFKDVSTSTLVKYQVKKCKSKLIEILNDKYNP